MDRTTIITRRSFIASTTATATMAVTGGLSINLAEANPLFGLFARLTFSQYAKSAAARVLATSAASAIVKPLTKNTISRLGRSRMNVTKGQMAAVGGFGSLINEFSGRLAGDIAADYGRYGGTSEFAAIHAENPIISGQYGKPQCLGILSSKDTKGQSIMLESPEIVALERLQDKALRSGFSGRDTAKMLLPMKMLNNGKFSYETGHKYPAVFESSEGVVQLNSRARGNEGFVTAKFSPHRGSRYQKFYVKQELG